MRIGIISDTHDRLARTMAAFDLLASAGAEALIHCGDITSPDIVHACGGLPGYYVFGNNDDDLALLRRAIGDVKGVCLDWGGEVTLAEKRIAVTHGHLSRDLRSLLEKKPDYLFFGHSHLAADTRDGFTRRINPGALHRAAHFSVAVLDLATDELQFLTVPR